MRTLVLDTPDTSHQPQTTSKLTLLVKSLRSIPNAMGMRVMSGMFAVSLAFKRHPQDCFSRVFELTNRVKITLTLVRN